MLYFGMLWNSIFDTGVMALHSVTCRKGLEFL